MMDNIDGRDLATIILTVFIPPAGVAVKRGFCGHFFLNLALTFFGFYIPGLVHGLYVVLTSDS